MIFEIDEKVCSRAELEAEGHRLLARENKGWNYGRSGRLSSRPVPESQRCPKSGAEH